ncbi:tetratricopeptide repeat protein [Gemmatimonadota bacterium]
MGIAASFKSGFFRILLITGVVVYCLPVINSPLRALQSQLNSIPALCDSGFALLEQEDYEAAQGVFRNALRLDRNNTDALLGMAQAMLALPRRETRALTYLRRAVEQSPEHMDIRYLKAYAHAQVPKNVLLSRNAGQKALDEIEVLLALNPSHGDAYYLRGLVYRDRFQDYENAIESFRTQIEVNPGHTAARVEYMQTAVEAGLWDHVIESNEAAPDLDSGSWDTLPSIAAAYWKTDRPVEAMKLFTRFHAGAPEEVRNIYFDLSYLLTPSEELEYSALSEEGRRAYWNYYWSTRNPAPKTGVNERLLEHFIRVAYARIEFGENKWPWDARGDFYIRYGEPDVRIGPNRPYPFALIDEWDFFVKYLELTYELGLRRPVFRPGWLEDRYSDFGTVDGVNGSGSSEVWLYLDKGIDIRFVNPVMSGDYLVGDGVGNSQLVEAMGRKWPVWSTEEEKIEIFDPLMSVATFRGTEGNTEMNHSIGLRPDEIVMFRSFTGEFAPLEARINLFTTDWMPAEDGPEHIYRSNSRPIFESRGCPALTHNVTFSAVPGEYLLTTLVTEPETGMRGTAREKVVLPDYSGIDLMMSDIMPAARIIEVGPGHTGRFIHGDLEVIPMPGRTLSWNQPLFIYFEIYNLVQDRYGGTSYQITYSVSELPRELRENSPKRRFIRSIGKLLRIRSRRSIRETEIKRTGIDRNVRSSLEIDLSALPDGVYDLTVTITDQVSGQVASNVLTVRKLPQ